MKGAPSGAEATRGYDVVVVGGGVVGSAVGLGLAECGKRVAVLDEGDRALRAARTNFGLVWVQTKGNGMPAHMHWTRRSADLWPAFAQRLTEMTGIDVEYKKRGGLVYCLGDMEFETRNQRVRVLRGQADVFDTQMLDRAELERLMPGVRFGPHVSGASFCPHDGHANPLMMMRAMHAALSVAGAHYRPDAPARNVIARGGRFVVDTPLGTFEADQVVLAAGHGNAALGVALGLAVPMHAERGQILVTERVRPFIPLPGSGLRQTEDGTVLIGSSQEDVGFDDRTTVAVGARIAARALRVLPELARLKLLRTWAGIRVLPPDKHPVYAQSARHPGAFLATCHSAVTLAAVHAADLAAAIAAGHLGPGLNDFHPNRFDVQKAA